MPIPLGPTPPQLRPSRARHWILLFAATLAIITYIDRVCISQAAGAIEPQQSFVVAITVKKRQGMKGALQLGGRTTRIDTREV